MFTNRQNVEIHNVPDDKVADLVAALHASGLTTEGHEHLPDIVCCVGSTQCKMAVSDTPKSYSRIMTELAGDAQFWREIGPLRINMNGCPNNCAHSWIADIGLRGRRRRGSEGRNVEGYTVYIGGRLDGAGTIADRLCEVDADALIPTLRRLLEHYLDQRQSPGETFGAYVQRVPLHDIREALLEETE